MVFISTCSNRTILFTTLQSGAGLVPVIKVSNFPWPALLFGINWGAVCRPDNHNKKSYRPVQNTFTSTWVQVFETDFAAKSVPYQFAGITVY